MAVTSFGRENLQPFISQQEASQLLSHRRVCGYVVRCQCPPSYRLPYGTKRLQPFHILVPRWLKLLLSLLIVLVIGITSILCWSFYIFRIQRQQQEYWVTIEVNHNNNNRKKTKQNKNVVW